MNIYKSLNEMVNYIEDNLENKIEYNKLSQFLGTNEYILQRVFSIICNTTLADYIRKRRLSNAGVDLYKTNQKIVDIAIKYQYDSATSFSRSFEKFHGIKPSHVRNSPDGLKFFPKFIFKENEIEDTKVEYSILETNELILYGTYVETDIIKIKNDAPIHFQNMDSKYVSMYGDIPYGMVEYIDRFNECKCKYWTLYNKKIDEFTKYIIPKSKWIVFKINSQNPKEIQETSDMFYLNFINDCKYKIRNLPELEYYHDNITELLFPIED